MLHTRKNDVTLPVVVGGTVAIQLPALATQPAYSTIVVVPGVTSDDAIIMLANKGNGSAQYNIGTGATAVVITAVQPSEGSAIVFFNNPGVSTGYVDRVYSFMITKP